MSAGSLTTFQPVTTTRRTLRAPVLRAHVARRLRELRQARGLTLSDVAREIPVARSTIQLMEQGRWGTRVEVVYRLAIFYGVPIREILPEWKR